MRDFSKYRHRVSNLHTVPAQSCTIGTRCLGGAKRWPSLPHQCGPKQQHPTAAKARIEQGKRFLFTASDFNDVSKVSKLLAHAMFLETFVPKDSPDETICIIKKVGPLLGNNQLIISCYIVELMSTYGILGSSYITMSTSFYRNDEIHNSR